MARDAGETFARAKAVGDQTSVGDKIDFRKDLDVFRFHLDAGEGVRLTTDISDPGNPDTVLALYDRTGTLLAVDDDSGPGEHESFIEYVNAGEGGRFYVVVSAFDRFPADEIGDPTDNNINGEPDYVGSGGREDVDKNYTLNFEYFGII